MVACCSATRQPVVWFADFLIANVDIVSQVVEKFRGCTGIGMDLLLEIEQRAMKLNISGGAAATQRARWAKWKKAKKKR